MIHWHASGPDDVLVRHERSETDVEFRECGPKVLLHQVLLLVVLTAQRRFEVNPCGEWGRCHPSCNEIHTCHRAPIRRRRRRTRVLQESTRECALHRKKHCDPCPARETKAPPRGPWLCTSRTSH